MGDSVGPSAVTNRLAAHFGRVTLPAVKNPARHFPNVIVVLTACLTACNGGAAGGLADDAAAAPPTNDAAGDALPGEPDAAPQPLPGADAASLDAAGPGYACRRDAPPIVMAHGFLAAGDTWGSQVRRFAANGECPQRFYAFDWNTLDRQTDHTGELDLFIDGVLAAEGVPQVDLMGHSAGGGLGASYLTTPARAAKVAHYVHVAGGVLDSAPAVPTLNVYSDGDTIVPGGDIPGTVAAHFIDEDHYAVATSEPTFRALWSFLRTGDPTTTSSVFVPGGGEVHRIAGRVMVLGDNTPDVGSTVQVFEADTDTGLRTAEAPVARFDIGAEGAWGPFEARAGQRYELRVDSPRPGSRPVRYYHPAFTGDDALVYLRTLPTTGLAGALLRQIPFTESGSVVVVFFSQHALLAGRDTLRVDGENLATAEIASPADTTIALFLYDAASDGVPGGSVAAFGAFPFLAGLDRLLTADATASLAVSFNGTSLAVPRWPGATEGASVVVFE